MRRATTRWHRFLGVWLAILGGSAHADVGLLTPSVAKSYATYYTIRSCQREGTSGILTASGQPYDEQAMTCALPHHRFGGWYRVCGSAGCATVRHNDYGPGRKARAKGVVIDLTPVSFLQVCGTLSRGKCLVELTEVRGQMNSWKSFPSTIKISAKEILHSNPTTTIQRMIKRGCFLQADWYAIVKTGHRLTYQQKERLWKKVLKKVRTKP